MALALRSVCDVGSPEWRRRYVFANQRQEGFEHALAESAKRELWFAEDQLVAFAKQGLKPNDLQCIGFKTPVLFAENRTLPDNAYVADLYEQVSFLGDLHRQIADVPNGGKFRLRIGQPPTDS